MENESSEQFRKDIEENGKIIFRITKDNHPLELFEGKPFINFLRKLFLTKRKTTYEKWRLNGGYPINFRYKKIN